MTEAKKNFIPGSTSFADGFSTGRYRSLGATSFMAVDEKGAVKIVKNLLRDGRKIERAELGLDGDWGCNSTTIYDGKFHKYDSYCGSPWATPILMVFFEDGPSESYECFVDNPYTKEQMEKFKTVMF